MASQYLARIAIFGLFLTQILEGNGQIFYPNAASANDFHVGDTLNVSLANPYGLASLLLYCNNETAPRENETVPASSTSPVLLNLGAPANPSCYLEITQDPNSYLTSVAFSISPSNGTVRAWSLDSQSEGKLPPALNRLATTGFSFDLAVPVTPRPPITLSDDGLEPTYILADGTNCLIVTASSSLHQGCWNALGLDQWLPQWFNETPKCPPGASSDTNCQSQDPAPEAWTSTFLREYGIATDDCLHLDSVVFSCQDYHQAPFTPDESPLLTARFEYVKSNIVAVARYLSAWHLALVDAASAANDAIKPIINLIDDQKKQKHERLAINIFLTVLGVALSFIPLIGSEAGLATLDLAVANAAITGVKKAPDMAKKLWPSGGDNTVDFQVDALTDLFNNGLLPSLETNIENLLSTVQGFGQLDPSAFLAFAGGGEFSVPTVQGPAAGAASDVQRRILKQAMTTFLVSTALSRNGWQALLVPGVDAEGLFNGDKACPDWASSQCNNNKDAMGCHGHYSSGQCFDSYWWYSVEQNSMYTLLHNGKVGDDDATGKLGQIFDHEWSTGPLLFENAAKCEFQNLLQTAHPQTYTYTPDLSFGNQGAGFTYDTLIAGLNVSYQLPQPGVFGSTYYFLPIAGSGFVELSKLSSVQGAQYHPISAPFAIQPTGGVDESCVSNLNVTIATSWGGKHNWQ